jgi:hypothetical protein
MLCNSKVLISTVVLLAATFGVAAASNATHADRASIYSTYQFPPTRTTTVRHTLRIALPNDIAATGALRIQAPTAFKVGSNIKVFDDSNNPINARIETIGQQIILEFAEPVAAGTKLHIDINNVQIWGTMRTYRVVDRTVNGESIDLGTATIRSY